MKKLIAITLIVLVAALALGCAYKNPAATPSPTVSATVTATPTVSPTVSAHPVSVTATVTPKPHGDHDHGDER